MGFRFAFRRYAAPFLHPVRTAHGLWTVREGVLLRLEDERGDVGFGEAAPIESFGTESVDEIEAFCRGLGSTISADPLIPETFPCLRAAWEAAGAPLRQREPARSTGTAVTRRAGAPYVPVAALLPAGPAARTALPPLAEAGFRSFKWKVGVQDARDEWGMLDDLLGDLPSGGKLRLDANGAWDRRVAERWLDRCAERPIEFLEQPVRADHLGAADLLLGLAADYPTPIALDESLVGPSHAERWLDLGWPGLWVIKPALFGTSGVVWERLGKTRERLVFSSALETAVGAQAALRAALEHGDGVRAVGFGVYPLFQDSRLNGPALAPFVRREDVEALNPEAVWNALS